MSKLKHPQYADDWDFLDHVCLPSNVDGIQYHIVERGGRFLFLEVKRGEDITGGQGYMLAALARISQFDVWVVHSLIVDADEKYCRRVVPYAIQKYDSSGNLGEKIACDPEQFRLRYHQWFRTQ